MASQSQALCLQLSYVLLHLLLGQAHALPRFSIDLSQEMLDLWAGATLATPFSAVSSVGRLLSFFQNIENSDRIQYTEIAHSSTSSVCSWITSESTSLLKRNQLRTVALLEILTQLCSQLAECTELAKRTSAFPLTEASLAFHFCSSARFFESR